MAAIASLLRLFPDAEKLSPTKPDRERKWVFSHIAPFAGRFVFEIMTCGGLHGEEFIRVLANDKVLQMGHNCQVRVQSC
jgi:hypothetical protein